MPSGLAVPFEAFGVGDGSSEQADETTALPTIVIIAAIEARVILMGAPPIATLA